MGRIVQEENNCPPRNETHVLGWAEEVIREVINNIIRNFPMIPVFRILCAMEAAG